MPKTEPRLTCAAAFLLMVGSFFLLLGIVSIWFSMESKEWIAMIFVIVLSTLVLVAGVAALFWRFEFDDSEAGNSLNHFVLKLIQFEFLRLTRWGWLLVFSTFVFWLLVVTVAGLLFNDWFDLYGRLAIAAAFGYRSAGMMLLKRWGLPIVRQKAQHGADNK